VHAATAERVQIGGQRGDERLALAGLHLGDLAAVQHHAADQLHVERPHSEDALGRLASRREGRDEKILDLGSLIELLAELGRARAQLVVAQGGELLFDRVDLVHQRPEPLELAIVLRADDFPDECAEHGRACSPCRSRRTAATPAARRSIVNSQR
jgi:hypothetical protein